MNAGSEIRVDHVDLDVLASLIREAGRPVPIRMLALAALRAWMETRAGERHYAPGDHYAVGETIQFNNELAEVKAVQDGENPVQGRFKILTLQLPDGTERRMAVEVAGAPAWEQKAVSDKRVRDVYRDEGLAIRTAVQEALAADDRFIWFQDAQADRWCLNEMLPEVTEEDLSQVWLLLQGSSDEPEVHPRATEELVEEIWGQSSDGSDAYFLRAFALNDALQRCQDVRWMGDGWVLESEWKRLQERPELAGPREKNVITPPPGIPLEAEAEEEESDEGKEEEPEEPTVIIEEDLEAWQGNRLLNATFTLRARHYHCNWLPLTQSMQRVFPPLASESYAVTFYHRFGGEEELFQAWVDRDQKRILGSEEMYQAFYEHGIYPGAELVVSHRGSLWEYDIRTKPATKEDSIRVRRVLLMTDEEGQPILGQEGHRQIEYEEIDEPRRYKVSSDEVFVAGASWENLPALFAEAERVAQGFYELMYEVCCEWWEAGGRKPLHVTADRLFHEIHYNRRLVTSEATIPWELWRRLAFESVGNGRFLFRPEKGERVRAIGPRARVPKSPVVRSGPKVRKDRSLEKIVQDVPSLTSIRPTPITDYELPLLKALVDAGGQGQPATDIYPRLEATVDLNEADRARQPSGNILGQDNACFAFEKLVSKGEAEKPARGAWQVTAKGRARLVEAGLLPPPSGPTVERRRDGQLIAADLVSPGPLFEKSSRMPEAYQSEQEPKVPTGSWVDEPSDEERQARIDAEFRRIREIIQTSLVGVTIYTLARSKPNRIVDADEEGLMVVARSESKVRWEWIKDIYEALCHLREIESKDVQEGEFQTQGGYRCAFIFPLLARFAHIEARTKPRRRLIYHEPQGPIQLGDAEREATAATPPSSSSSPTPSEPASAPPATPPSGRLSESVSSAVKRDDMQTKTLFSQHYLENRLPDHPEWGEDPHLVFEAVRDLWQEAREHGATWNEAQTEEEFIRPVLNILGWSFIVQPKAHQGGQVTRPDYALFSDETAKSEAMPHQGHDDAFYSRAQVIGEAKYWDRPLSQKDTSGRETWKRGNPSHQMVSYLVGTHVPWGILTNGRAWRLYSREVSSTASEFYEVDLGLIFDFLPPDGKPSAEQLDQFRRWWLFFWRDAFTPDPQSSDIRVVSKEEA